MAISKIAKNLQIGCQSLYLYNWFYNEMDSYCN